MGENNLQDVTIIKTIYYDNSSGFFVGQMSDGRDIVCYGAILPLHGDVTVMGSWEYSQKYRKDQLVAKKIFFKDAKDAVTVLVAGGFLKGIKGHKVLNVIETLGNRIFDVMDKCVEEKIEDQMMDWNGQKNVHSHKILQSVKGVGPVVAEQMMESYREKRGLSGAAVLAIQAGLNMRQYKSALMTIGKDKLIEYILHNPYKLTTVENFNWETVDVVAKLSWNGKEVIPHDSPNRLAAAVREVITKNYEQGHMAKPLNEALVAAEQLAQPTVNLWKTIEKIIDDEGMIVMKHGNMDMITTSLIFELENETATMLHSLLKSKPRFDPVDVTKLDLNKYAKFELAPEQADAVRMALLQTISVVSGGPGTGKTSAFLETTLNILDAHEIRYTLCAPTGKAALRMQEAVGRRAATLHREFRLFEDPPANCSTPYLFIDEASMLSADIFRKVLTCLQPGQRLVLIGDADQLPPVGPGEPLMQMMSSPFIPVTRLSHIYRQGKNSGIITAAHDINNGIDPKTSPNGDFTILNVNPQDFYRTLVAQIDNLRKIGYKDIMVLTPVNQRDFGREGINKHLQNHYNPDGTKVQGSWFRLQDPVIQIKNDYEIDIMNGQVGQITKVFEKEKASFLEDDETPVMEVFFEFTDAPLEITKERLRFLQLAYALTIHKTQGSQFKAVIVVAPHVYHEFYLRQLVYTGITRAEEVCVVITQGNALHQYVINDKKIRRTSLLAEMLKFYMNKEIT